MSRKILSLVLGIVSIFSTAAAVRAAPQAEPPTPSEILSFSTTTTLWVDATNGDDLTAQRGQADRPWRTLTNALPSALCGDLIHLRPGVYEALGRGEPTYGALSDRTHAPLQIGSLTNVTIEGEGHDSVIQFEGMGHIFSVYQSDGITFRDFRMKGPGSNLNLQFPKRWTNIFGAITLWSARGTTFWPGSTNQNIRFERLEFEDIPDHALLGVPETRNSFISVDRCEFRRVGDAFHEFLIGDGACVASLGSFVTVTGCLFDDVQHGIEIENSFGFPSDTMSDWIIAGNTLRNVWRHGITVWPGPHAVEGGWSRFLIMENLVGMTPTNYPDIWDSVAIQCSGGTHVSIVSNTVSGYHDYGIAISPNITASNVVIAHNWIRGSRRIGISVQRGMFAPALHTVVSNNIIADTAGFAAILCSGIDTRIVDNSLTDTSSGCHGVWLGLGAPGTAETLISGNAFVNIGGTNIVVEATVRSTTLGLNTTRDLITKRIHDSSGETLEPFVWQDEPLISIRGSFVELQFIRLPGNTYTIYHGNSLLGNSWQAVAHFGLSSFTDPTIYLDTLSPDIGACFYRISSP